MLVIPKSRQTLGESGLDFFRYLAYFVSAFAHSHHLQVAHMNSYRQAEPRLQEQCSLFSFDTLHGVVNDDVQVDLCNKNPIKLDCFKLDSFQSG